jgi:hypothetical protein
MDLTMGATPKARLAAESSLPFPVPPPPDTERMMPVFAFPPPNDPKGPTRAQEMPPTRRTTARVPGRRGSLSDSLAGLASFVENAPLPALPESVWRIIGRAWFFVAGATIGILLALVLIAVTGPKHAPPREGRIVTAEGTARVLVVQRAETAVERGLGPLAENDIDEVAPAPASPPAARRAAIVARRGAAAPRRPAAGGKDLLDTGL